MQNRLIKGTLIIHIFLSFITSSASGQKLVNSPLSRFNLGTLEPAGSFRSMGMGGIGTSMRDNSSIYISNPASYSSLDTNSFLFDFGLDYSINILNEGKATFSSDDINFDHLIIGFPLAKGIGLATGILPLSNGYYKIAELVKKGNPDYDPVTGEYTSTHVGEGGFTNVFLGSGIKVNKKLSAGINLTLLMGGVKRVAQYNFADLNNFYHNNGTENLRLTGINFDYGVQYTAPLKKNYFINLGASLTAGKNYKTKYEKITYRYTVYRTIDTLTYVADNSTRSFLPGTLRLGVSAGKKDMLVVGLDFVTTKWSKAKIQGAEGYLGNTSSLLFGAEYTPDKYSNYNYLNRIEYRLGGHIGDNYLVIDKTQFKEYGFSAGIGLPLRRTFSKANLFFDFTKKSGKMSNNPYFENFYTMGASLNFYDRWFMKRKYE
jgi:hypothetical protein